MIKTNAMNRAEFQKQNNYNMPALFIGHGSPMNAIELNEFSSFWNNLGTILPQPKAVLCISAHWETRGSLVTGMKNPKTIHDFYGFPKNLYELEYKASGSPDLAESITKSIDKITIDEEWGLDHGTWSILQHLYPKADIPVIQISIDFTKGLKDHFELAQELAFLRKEGVLIIGSGNIVHNLRMMSLKTEDINTEYAYEWATEVNETIKSKILDGDISALTRYNKLGHAAELAIPSLEHYIPMIYALGMKNKNENIHFFNDKIIAGSLSMTSFTIS